MASHVDKLVAEDNAEEKDPYLHWIKYSTRAQLTVEAFMKDRTDAKPVLKLLLDHLLDSRDLEKFEEVWDDAMTFHPKLPSRLAQLWCAELLIYGSVNVPEAVAALRDIQSVVNTHRGDVISAVDKAMRKENDLMRTGEEASADGIDDVTVRRESSIAMVRRESSMPTVRRESSIATETN